MTRLRLLRVGCSAIDHWNEDEDAALVHLPTSLEPCMGFCTHTPAHAFQQHLNMDFGTTQRFHSTNLQSFRGITTFAATLSQALVGSLVLPSHTQRCTLDLCNGTLQQSIRLPGSLTSCHLNHTFLSGRERWMFEVQSDVRFNAIWTYPRHDCYRMSIWFCRACRRTTLLRW